MANSGMTYREIYNSVFLPSHKGMSFNTFKRKLQDWRKKKWTDDKTLEAANLDWQFTPYAATVQVNSDGEVVQS